MKRFLYTFLTLFLGFLFLLPFKSFAIENPVSIPNNKIGVHILFPSELNDAANLINSSGGDWGYVTIPIQAGDKDIEKWQKFMDDAKRLHIIPIIRLATEGDYFNTTAWRKPTDEDVLDFANFLNSLSWPVKNRYIVVFNEVNRSDEWGGDLDPGEYANLLSYAVTTFKSVNNDFFIISGGLDNAAPNFAGKYMDEYDYMVAMNQAVPGIFSLVDGLGSHSYPNPGFSQMPYILTSQSIDSFNFERDLAYRLSNKNLPIFITETGWSEDVLSQDQIADYFKYAFSYVWSDNDVVAVTTFLLQGGQQSPFTKFSLTNADGSGNAIFKALQEISKIKGKPTINPGVTVAMEATPTNLPAKIFTATAQPKTSPVPDTSTIEKFFKWLFMLSN